MASQVRIVQPQTRARPRQSIERLTVQVQAVVVAVVVVMSCCRPMFWRRRDHITSCWSKVDAQKEKREREIEKSPEQYTAGPDRRRCVRALYEVRYKTTEERTFGAAGVIFTHTHATALPGSGHHYHRFRPRRPGSPVLVVVAAAAGGRRAHAA